MPELVVVETNWLLDLVLDQHPASVRLSAHADAGLVLPHVPDFAIAEAVKVIERRQAEIKQLIVQLGERSRELARGGPSAPAAHAADALREDLAAYADKQLARLWDCLDRVWRWSEVLHSTRGTFELASEIALQLELTPGDAIVLACVAESASTCREFISRDRRAFDSPPTRAYLRDIGVTYYADPAHFLQAHAL